MEEQWPEYLKHIGKSSVKMQQANPDMIKAFQDMKSATHSNDVIDNKTKELIAIAVSVARQCDGCIAAHARQAKLAGATREEVGAAIQVAMTVAAGGAFVYGSKVFDAFDQF
ncbi:carboxymuconolactone decarboxylase family protein [Vibrio nitrifigilis]|nr:carboxymuconolactone decarboxylase family protein [Vibrio nitrifigilis]